MGDKATDKVESNQLNHCIYQPFENAVFVVSLFRDNLCEQAMENKTIDKVELNQLNRFITQPCFEP